MKLDPSVLKDEVEQRRSRLFLQHAARAAVTLRNYSYGDEEEQLSMTHAVADLLADVLHLADVKERDPERERFNLETAVALAVGYYQSDLQTRRAEEDEALAGSPEAAD